jgi:hypothetical protein
MQLVMVKKHVARHFWKYDVALHTVLTVTFAATQQWVELCILVSEYGARKASEWFDELDQPELDQTPYTLADWSATNESDINRSTDWL